MQIVCQHLEPRGLGALQLAFEQLKRRLDAEGLFAAARKRPLPLLPRTIGIVTSLEGAAVRDIVRVVTNRHAGAAPADPAVPRPGRRRLPRGRARHPRRVARIPASTS